MMSFLSWPFSRVSTSDSESKENTSARFDVSAESLVRRIQEDHAKLQKLQILCDEQKNNVDKLNTEIKELRKLLDQEKTISAKLQKDNKKRCNELKTLHNAMSNRNRSLERAQLETSTAAANSAKLSSSLATADSTIVELKFENELLKCTSNTNNMKPIDTLATATQNSSPASPFVLVLIDADAYHWNHQHFAVRETTPGAHAAQSIKEEVREYLVSNVDQISLQVKIVVRAICNARGLGRGRRDVSATSKRRNGQMQDFMVQFSESMPLFDFFDAGRGKERVDEKIKETFHLFISNPSCQRIFFAGCTDNGFARLLEQYCNNTANRNKIVLVHPGYIASELERFNLVTVEWPRVFAQRLLPQASQVKITRDKTRLIEQENARNRDREAGERKYGKIQYARILLEAGVAAQVLESCDQFEVLSRFRARAGVRATDGSFQTNANLECEDWEATMSWDLGID